MNTERLVWLFGWRRIKRLSHADLTVLVIVTGDSAARDHLSLLGRYCRWLALRELRRREAVTDDAARIYRGR